MSEYKQTRKFKTGDTVVVNSNIYHVNGMGAELKKKLGTHKAGWEYKMAQEKTFFVNPKYLVPGDDVAATMRSWFDGKQPTMQQVRNAMIWGYDQFGDYQIKAGGESASDNIYSSHLKITIADENGNDKDVVFLKKYSTNFSDVLITIEEVEALQRATETQEMKDENRKDNLCGTLGFLTRYYGGYEKKLTQETVDKIIANFKAEYTKEELLGRLDYSISLCQKEIDLHENSGYIYNEKSDPKVESKKGADRERKKIAVLESLKEIFSK